MRALLWVQLVTLHGNGESIPATTLNNFSCAVSPLLLLSREIEHPRHAIPPGSTVGARADPKARPVICVLHSRVCCVTMVPYMSDCYHLR